LEKFELIPYGHQNITEEDIEAVVKVLRSDFLTQGPIVPVFEQKLCDYTGAKYAVAVNSCTSALHIACIALDLGPGDILWTSPITFVASANCALYCGATVDFVDIETNTALMDVKKLAEKLDLAKKENKLPKIVVPVHFAGQPCDMKGIYALSQQYGFKIIEDAAHAIGARYRGEVVGNCRYSDITVFSFHPVKVMTTGEGGSAMTNSLLLAEKMELFRSHGITKNKEKFINENDGGWYYEQHVLGYNYRLTDIQAALGISQLKRLNSFINKRQEIAKRYFNELKNITLPYQHSDRSSSWHLFVVQVENRREKYDALKEQGILTQVHYIPINSQPIYKSKKLHNSDNFYKKCLSIPIYADLTNKDQSRVISNL
jgi:UDP-4-amino-4,6-dideoxy-N-acetyl-beta-L-altrosamine transaminase